MENLPKCEILQYNPDTIKEVRKTYNLEKGEEMKNAVDILEEWVKQQKHFKKKNFAREYLEIAIISSKGSVERAKYRLEKLCTYKTQMPIFFGDYDLRNDLKGIEGKIHISLLPKLTDDHYRIIIYRNTGKSFDHNLCLEASRMVFTLAELLRRYDYANGYILIADLLDENILEVVSKLNISLTHQAMSVLMQGYGLKLKKIYALMPLSKLSQVLLSVFTSVISPKIRAKLQVYSSRDQVIKDFSKDCLPADYEGNERPLAELHDTWINYVSQKDQKDFIREMFNAGIYEELRPKDSSNDEKDSNMGISGTFRSLSID